METCQNSPWQSALAASFTDVRALLDSLGLSPEDIPELDPEPNRFRLLVPRGFAALMRHGDPNDPLLHQVLPRRAEHDAVDGFVTDPVGDGAANLGDGLLQKYAGRALLMATGACAVHCRYCFRRHYPYSSLAGRESRHEAAIARIRADPSLTEAILSGGDPLMLDDRRLERLVRQLDAIPHLQRLRIHTRLPVVLPERIEERLVRILTSMRMRPVLVIHANHPRELGTETCGALQRLHREDVTLLNQSVLLKGVNDDPEVLQNLSERLFEQNVLPYYIHQLDRVQGAAHFGVSDGDARRILNGLRARIPGYLVPRLVREIPGGDSKTPIDCNGEP
ncbi:EF-P beta-lysylation protein EpmB [Imhoffiella purpurea]|uniref:L-lysine 2,3-aminomutase n=1 Tax=Imhoffiella purpurea TaxID=1249627 RepID=W9V716_9GAMM|nr:Lysyl-lysine 2,3-aminomutase [Imhoffiella purpurea]